MFKPVPPRSCWLQTSLPPGHRNLASRLCPVPANHRPRTGTLSCQEKGMLPRFPDPRNHGLARPLVQVTKRRLCRGPRQDVSLSEMRLARAYKPDTHESNDFIVAGLPCLRMLPLGHCPTSELCGAWASESQDTFPSQRKSNSGGGRTRPMLSGFVGKLVVSLL